jgi:hypothetical protein
MGFEWNKENLKPDDLGVIRAEIWENPGLGIERHLAWWITIGFEHIPENNLIGKTEENDDGELNYPTSLYCGAIDFNVRDWNKLDGFYKRLSVWDDDIEIGINDNKHYEIWEPDIIEIKIEKIKNNIFNIELKVYENEEEFLEISFESIFESLYLTPANIKFNSLDEAIEIASEFIDLDVYNKPFLSNSDSVWFEPKID